MQDPVKYETNKSVATDIVNKFLPKLLSKVEWEEKEKVLDYGCGAGSTGYNWLLPKIERFNSTLYSVDVSAKMLEYAKKRYPHERITYGVGNILDSFPFENEKFDKIFAINVIHFIKDIRKALFGFYKCMKIGGYLCFTVPLATHIVARAYNEMALTPAWKPYMEHYVEFHPDWSVFPTGQERRGMYELLKTNGFQVVELEVLQRSYHFHSIETFLEFSLSINPCLNNIPSCLSGVFREDLRKTLTHLAGVPEDSTSIDFLYSLAWGVIQKD